ncbi:hypothetical protein BJQ94_07140 [Cryobacterium sp. SO2]|uniref:GNAT family N-acetyltransferase n=1 Tax=Cryobacterium sp. SO2 TaxID=1897060 RepID=UPI00223E195A|nr:GNAT family N-acetyltransferase [Cryobacterium sp. SO2]WEO78797.1 hypothetical protein BJQ94_07140 [Cryobacterium sp. SO2]
MNPRTSPDLVALELRLLSALDAVARDAVGCTLGELDYPVAAAPTGSALVQSYLLRAPESSWALWHNGAPAGVFAVVPYLELAGAHQTSTYLAPGARGSGLNAAVKRAAIVAARASSLSLYSSVHHANARSVAATRRLFTAIDPTKVFEHTAGRLAWRFDLSDPWARLADGPVHADLVDTLVGAFRHPARQAA